MCLCTCAVKTRIQPKGHLEPPNSQTTCTIGLWRVRRHCKGMTTDCCGAESLRVCHPMAVCGGLLSPLPKHCKSLAGGVSMRGGKRVHTDGPARTSTKRGPPWVCIRTSSVPNKMTEEKLHPQQCLREQVRHMQKTSMPCSIQQVEEETRPPTLGNGPRGCEW